MKVVLAMKESVIFFHLPPKDLPYLPKSVYRANCPLFIRLPVLRTICRTMSRITMPPIVRINLLPAWLYMEYIR